MRIKIVVAELHAVLRAGLCCLLNREPDLVVRAQAGSGSETARVLREGRTDVLLMGLDMKGGGVPFIRQTTKRHPRVKVLILSAHDDSTLAQAALAAGAAGYLVKTCSEQELFSALRAVHDGRTFIDVHLDKRRPVSPGRAQPPGGGVPPTLTAREQETLALLSRGHTNREIGGVLGIGVKTVETYRGRIRDKLGLKTRADLVGYGLRSGNLGTGEGVPSRKGPD